MHAARQHLSHIDDSVPRPVVVGTDIKVSQIAEESERRGMSPDEIIEAHPHLTLAQVHAALAYYHDNREAIRADWQATDDLVAELRRQYPNGLHSG